MEMTRKGLCAFLFLAILVVSVRGKEKGNYSSTRTTLAQTNVTSNTSAKLPKGSDQDVVNNKKVNNGVGGGGGGGGGGGSWGWGGGGGGGGGGGAAPGSGGGGGRGGGRGAMGGGGGWGWGGGGGGSWGWGCRNSTEYNHAHKKRPAHENQYYKIGEFAQCVMKGRCQGIRLDCPLHCGGPCFYDCKNMCKAHCRR